MDGKNHLSHAIKFGIILGVLRTLLDIAIKYFDASAVVFNLSAIIGLGIEFIIVFLALKLFKQKNKDFNVKDAIKIGVIMLIIAGAMLFFSVNFYHPEYANNKLIELTKQVQPDQLETTLINIRQAKENPSYFSNFVSTLVKFIMIGAIIGLLNGLIITFTKSKTE